MTDGKSTPRSRRAVLAASLAAGIGAVAGSLGRPTFVNAGVDGDVVLGSANPGAATTSIDAALNDAVVSIENRGAGPALSLVASGSGPGLYTVGRTYLDANPPVLVVRPTEGTEPAVQVLAVHAPAMLLEYPTDRSGLLVYGGVYPPSTLPTNVGVYVKNPDGYTGTGVGASRGVVADSGSGIGVVGLTSSGIGVLASASSPEGTGLSVKGKLKLSRSGRTLVTAGSSSRTITMAGVTTSSWVIATLQTNRAGVYVQSVVPAAGKFTIHLNKSVSGTTYVGYLVVN